MRSDRRSDRTVVVLLALAALLAACSQPPESSGTPPSPAPASSASASATPSVRTPAPTAEASASAGASGGVYLAIGDSITFGIGVPRPLEEGYVARVRDALVADPSPAVPVAETRLFAVPGETAAGFLDRRLDAVLQTVADNGARVELVTIGLGANELLRARRDPSCESDRESPACRAIVDAAITAAIDALDRIVGSVQAALDAAGSDARVLLLAYYNPDPDPLAEATVAGPDSTVACTTVDPGLDDRIACVAEQRGVGIVDLHAAFRGRELELTRFGNADVHPNAAGYAVIADAILARLEAAP